MADVTHASLTGSDLHEPKGVASAADNTIAQASGNVVSWSSEINPSKITLSTTVKNFIEVPISACALLGTSDPDLTKLTDDGSASNGVYEWAFDPATEEEVYFNIILPEGYKAGTDITPSVTWAPVSTNTGDVVFGLEYITNSVGDTVGNSTIITVTDAGDGTAKKIQNVEFTAITGTSFVEGDIVSFRFYRDADNGSDTFTGNAYVFKLSFEIETEKIGSTI